MTGNDLGVLPQLTCVMSNPCFREHVPLSVLAEHLDVVDLGMNAVAKLDGSVHGVVVQMIAFAPSNGEPGATSGMSTVTAGS